MPQNDTGSLQNPPIYGIFCVNSNFYSWLKFFILPPLWIKWDDTEDIVLPASIADVVLCWCGYENAEEIGNTFR